MRWLNMSHSLPPTDIDHGRIFLTFEDGPDPEWTPRVLDILAAYGACATFFLIGHAARANVALVRRIADEGHEIGNHSWSHRHPWTLSQHAARSEVRQGAASIADLIGRRPKYFRPAHGRMRWCMIDEAEENDQQLALWSVSAVDWGPLGSSAAIAARLRKARDGDILLMHDGGRGVNRPDALVRALPQFLEGIASDRLYASPLANSILPVA